MKRFPCRQRTVLAVAGVLLCVGLLEGVMEPQSLVGSGLFRAAYALPSLREPFLRFYQWSLAEYNGGCLPANADRFLTDRLGRGRETSEETMIIDFQIRLTPDRWGDSACHADPAIKQRIVSNIMNRLDRMSDRDALHGMEFIESLRKGNPLNKGGFTNLSAGNGEMTMDQRRDFEEAKHLFKHWWSEERNWNDLQSINPLADSALKITAQ